MRCTDRKAPHYVVFSNLSLCHLIPLNPKYHAESGTTYLLIRRRPSPWDSAQRYTSVNKMKRAHVICSTAHKGLIRLYRSVNTFKPNKISTQQAHDTCVTSKQKPKNITKQTECLKQRSKTSNIQRTVLLNKKRCRAARTGGGTTNK